MHQKPWTIKKTIITVIVVLLIGASVFGYWRYQENIKAEAAAQAAEAAETARLAAERLKALIVKAHKPTTTYERPAPPPPEPRQNILDYMELNPDTIGYLKIEGTRVDYPVVQGTDNDYYLNYTFDHIKATRASIFLDFNVKFDPLNLPRHMLIHGHHMKDGSMFNNIALYKGEKFFNEHPYINFETLYQDTVWQVFSVYVVDSNEYVPMGFRSDEAYVEYMQKIAARSIFPVDIELGPDDLMMTLNTCSYEFGGAHTLLAAKLVEVYED